MKAFVKLTSFLIVFVLSYLSLFSYFIQISDTGSAANNSFSSQAAGHLSATAPSRLTIPAINVDANVQSLGVATNGEMEVPTDILEVGWFNLGPLPGQIGNATIAGHLNGPSGETGVFANLHKLQIGDKIYIKDTAGKSTTFIVKGSRTYLAGYAEEVFSSNNGAHLNLITCKGVWNENIQSYTKRLVISADLDSGNLSQTTNLDRLR